MRTLVMLTIFVVFGNLQKLYHWDITVHGVMGTILGLFAILACIAQDIKELQA